MDYVKQPAHTGSSGISKAALALGITGTGLAVLNGGNGILPGLFGARNAAPALVDIELATQGGFVTGKELKLVRELGDKDAVIAQLTAEKYADGKVAAYDREIVRPLENRVCALETSAAVNSARDSDFRRYVNAEFVHQPKASIKESIVVCRQCGCECDHDGHCGCR